MNFQILLKMVLVFCFLWVGPGLVKVWAAPAFDPQHPVFHFPAIDQSNGLDQTESLDGVDFDPNQAVSVPGPVEAIIQTILVDGYHVLVAEFPDSLTRADLEKGGEGGELGPVFKPDVSKAFGNKQLYVLKTQLIDRLPTWSLIVYDPVSGICGSNPVSFVNENWIGYGFEDLSGEGQKDLKIETTVDCGTGCGGNLVRYYSLDSDLSCREVFGYKSQTAGINCGENTKIIKKNMGVLTLLTEHSCSDEFGGVPSDTKKTFTVQLKDFNPEETEKSFQSW